jgi:pyruvate-formate lyase
MPEKYDLSVIQYVTAMIDEYQKVDSAIKTLTEKKNHLKDKLKDWMLQSEKEKFDIPGTNTRISYSQRTKKTLKKDMVLAALEELNYETDKFFKETKYDVLAIKELKKDD